MKATMRTLILFFVLTLPAAAQYQNGFAPNPRPLNYLPNYYNRNNQPLSPYLNLFGGNNPSVNYYFGTRPGTPAGGVNAFGQAPPYQPFVGVLNGGFLPQSNLPNDGSGATYEPGGQPILLRSAAHPVVYGNQFGNHGSFASVYANRFNRTGTANQGGQQLPSTQGVGNAPPRK